MPTTTTHSRRRGPPHTAAPAQGGGSELLDLEQAITALKTTRQTFYRWLRSGKLKGMKVGRQWRFYKADVERFLKGEEPVLESGVSLAPLLKQLQQCALEYHLKNLPAAKEANTATAVDLMIALACGAHASGLHLAPYSQGPGQVATLRFRIDGVLRTIAEMELRLLKPLVDRWKTMANCDLHERNKPQDGRIEWEVGGHTHDLRISFLPTLFGESLTVRLLSAETLSFDLRNMGLAPQNLQRLEKALCLPWGLILVTGPTGSGKTTMLYSCLTRCASPALKIITIEDPVEYVLPGILQMVVRQQHGVTCVTALRAILRQDPDVILVGEIPNLETLEGCQQAALTGHLVLTTLHADEAVNALQRMVDMGTEPFLIGEAVKLIMAQRLVRKLCPHCSRKAELSASQRTEVEALVQRNGLKPEDLQHQFRAPVGCPRCVKTGFRGRMPIAETLVVTPELVGALSRKAAIPELRALAIARGMTTLIGDGLLKAGAGQTTLEEVLRHTPGN